MTWNELAKHIEKMDDDQKQFNVTVFVTSDLEYVEISKITYSEESGSNGDILIEPMQPFLIVDY